MEDKGGGEEVAGRGEDEGWRRESENARGRGRWEGLRNVF